MATVGERLLLKPAEAAELIGLGRSKTYALIRAGELPSVRLGSSLRVPLRELQAWVERLAHE
jgi:excisionase family DNA binding protein